MCFIEPTNQDRLPVLLGSHGGCFWSARSEAVENQGPNWCVAGLSVFQVSSRLDRQHDAQIGLDQRHHPWHSSQVGSLQLRVNQTSHVTFVAAKKNNGE